MKLSIKNFFSKCDQIRSFLRIWSHLLKKSLMENFTFCAVLVEPQSHSSFILFSDSLTGRILITIYNILKYLSCIKIAHNIMIMITIYCFNEEEDTKKVYFCQLKGKPEMR